MKKISQKYLLIILDGWGITKPSIGNAITLAKTPTYDFFIKNYPNTLLEAHGSSVGLPKNQDGNSEAGHMNIGAGRIVLQDDIYITKAIEQGIFFKNPAFLEALNHSKKYKSNIHLIGILSGDQSPHVDSKHINALLQLLEERGLKKIYLHLFTDGRDSSEHGSIKFLKELKSNFKNGEVIASIMGRFYAMDRNKVWFRTELAYNAIVNGKGLKVDSAEDAITRAYNRGETDEFIKPSVIYKNGKPVGKVSDDDSVIFFNLRSDRARQLTKLFVQHDVCEKNKCSIKRGEHLKNIKFVSMTDFGPDLDNILTAFPSRNIKETLPMQLSHLRQLYISESEKFAHVTYFINGGYKDPVGNESREMIPSPSVNSYSLTPQMSADKLVRKVVNYIKTDKYDFICVNFANPDMVAHTGDLKAGIKAVESVDKSLKYIKDSLREIDVTIFITADHGNIEEMIDLETGETNTSHSTNPVPFIFVSKKYKTKKLRNGGILGDIAPTILDVMNLQKPKEMKRESLIIK
ncbi:MAG TPA: 2,3-bisphosphoglycerate-independent phosphoglycerate mutase [bacterium]|nr:2,3-bisphosphoglycerate-independent phosphoglycerate mutase [bacterium]